MGLAAPQNKDWVQKQYDKTLLEVLNTNEAVSDNKDFNYFFAKREKK